MTVILKRVHVMVDDHCSSVVLSLYLLAGLSVYKMDESLLKE